MTTTISTQIFSNSTISFILSLLVNAESSYIKTDFPWNLVTWSLTQFNELKLSCTSSYLNTHPFTLKTLAALIKKQWTHEMRHSKLDKIFQIHHYKNEKKYHNVSVKTISFCYDYFKGLSKNSLIKKYGKDFISETLGSPLDPFTAEQIIFFNKEKHELIDSYNKKLSNIWQNYHKDYTLLTSKHNALINAKAKKFIEENNITDTHKKALAENKITEQLVPVFLKQIENLKNNYENVKLTIFTETTKTFEELENKFSIFLKCKFSLDEKEKFEI